MHQLSLMPPTITKFMPALNNGLDNVGIGETAHGERYLLKTDASVALSEFIGASICQSAGIPCGEPRVVAFKGGLIFGSRIELGVSVPAPSAIPQILATCCNPTIFSAVLAVDLATGNYDRHWHNWLYHDAAPATGTLVRAIDFSRAWPAYKPPMNLTDMGSHNTGMAWRAWSSLGIVYDGSSAEAVCDHLETLNANWLSGLVGTLPAAWTPDTEKAVLLDWWQNNWGSRVRATRQFLQSGAWS